MADNSARIAQLNTILETSVTASTIDGTSVAIDLDSLRKERDRLMAEDNTARIQKPRLTSVNISRLF